MNNSAQDNKPSTSPQSEQEHKEVGVYKGFAFTSTASIVNIIALFVETFIAVRLLSIVDYGIYVLLIQVTNFVIMATDFGCKISITQLIASGNRDRQAVLTNSVLSLRIIICLLMSAVVWFGRDVLAGLDPENVGLVLYAASIPAMYAAGSIEQLLGGMLKGFKLYDHAAIAQAVRSLARVVLSLLFLLVFNLGIMALVYSWVLSFALAAIYQYMKLPISKRWSLHPPSLRETLRFGFPIQMSAFLWYVSWQLHYFLLGALAGPAFVALYDVANKIPASLHRFSESYISVFFPTMSSLLAEKNHKKASWMLDQSLRISSFIIGVGTLFSVLFSREIMAIFKLEYVVAAPTFSILMLTFHMTFMVHLLGYTLTSAGHPQRSLVENSVRTAISAALGILLIPQLKYLGAAVGQLVANYVANPVAVTLLRQVDIQVRVAPYAKQTALLLLFCIAGWFMGGMELGLTPSIAYRLLMVVGFIVVSFLISTVSLDDLQIVLPKSVQAKLGIQKAEVSPAS